MKKKGKFKTFLEEFKAFINKGNAFMLAVGVVIGGAFNAIVTSLVNILMSVATWGVPGGLKGLVTVLPALNDAQKGIDGIGQFFDASMLQTHAETVAKANYAAQIADNPNYLKENPALIESAKTFLTSKYTLHGTTYTYNLSAVIDWGTFINAVIAFIIIALTLFIVVKVMNSIEKKNAEVKAKALEQYYEKHPEERPVPPEPGKPVPTEMDVLCEIRDALVQKKQEEPSISE